MERVKMHKAKHVRRKYLISSLSVETEIGFNKAI
jgi:hypothetical protein